MNVTDMIAKMGGLQSIAKELGVSEAQAASGAAALVPAIVGGFKKQAQSSGGAAGLGGLLGKLGGGALLDNVLAPQATDVSKGNDVLGAIFGSKDVSRAVAQNAATQSGVDASVLKKMLPMLAMVVTGMMAKQGGGAAPAAPSGGLGGMLGGLLGGKAAGAASALSGGGLGGFAKMLDADGDGNPLDDIMKMMGK
jgi:hypothetical protein